MKKTAMKRTCELLLGLDPPFDMGFKTSYYENEKQKAEWTQANYDINS
jgi:hypothetical protein